MITILDIGMNHETAPVELRECIARDPGNASMALASMREVSTIREGFFLSTCNRVEALCITEHPDEARESVISLLSRLGNVPEDNFLSSLFNFEDSTLEMTFPTLRAERILSIKFFYRLNSFI